VKDDGEIPDLLPRSRARPDAVRPLGVSPSPAVPSPAVPSPAVDPPTRPSAAPPRPGVPTVPGAGEADDLEFDLTRERGSDLPWDSPLWAAPPAAPREAPALRGAALPATNETPELVLAPSPRAAASERPPQASASRRPPPPTLDLGLESTVWDLDDELGDPRAAQLNVAVPMKAADDVPWPGARTPNPADLDISVAEIERARDLAPPSSWVQAPLYFWSARAVLRRLAAELATAEQKLTQAERQRDDILAELARGVRPKVEGSDRFVGPYELVDRAERAVLEGRAGLARADAQGETGLAAVDVELETARGTILLRTRDTAERRTLAEGGQRDLARLRAVHQRHVIEKRNIVARAQETSAPGTDMPPELAGRFLAVEEQIRCSEADLEAAQRTQKELEQRLRLAEEEERRALAHAQRIEGKREGLVLAQEGTLGDLNHALMGAERALLRAQADVGLAIVELRGEVPVHEDVRRRLLELDRTLTTHSTDAECRRRAAEGIDRAAYERGRIMLVASLVLALAAIGWALAS